MSANCCNTPCNASQPPPPSYRWALWIALAVNLGMFGVELVAGWGAGSVSLLADAVDFLGDAANYGLSLFVLSMGLAARARTALAKGAFMGSYGLYVLGQAAWNGVSGVMPEPLAMGLVGTLALAANLGVAALLYVYRDGDANMRSVWLCSRNDAIGNLAILVAALGVFGSGSAWPDLGVAALMAILGLTGAWQVVRHARHELAMEQKPILASVLKS